MEAVYVQYSLALMTKDILRNGNAMTIDNTGYPRYTKVIERRQKLPNVHCEEINHLNKLV